MIVARLSRECNGLHGCNVTRFIFHEWLPLSGGVTFTTSIFLSTHLSAKMAREKGPTGFAIVRSLRDIDHFAKESNVRRSGDHPTTWTYSANTGG